MTTSYDDKERETIKASLKSWWSNFTKTGKGSNKDRKSHTTNKVFGEPLRKSLKYASVAISMADEDGNQYVWGYVPVIVAKVGLFLKENATEVEGVFRIAGSQKRMRELQESFDTPPRYGKQQTWEKYSVHDAASVLRRYLNQMPEPIVPLQLYNEFRNAMHKQPVDVEAAIRTYRLLVQSMPPANRYLLLYVLDLLAVFARKSDVNLMTASNLAVIFQPGIFSHPSHLQDANEHKVAVEVLEFLIVHQDHFVLAISPPPPTNVGPSELTSVSLPAANQQTDVAELSESDEELGELTVHEGGGAKLARRQTTDAGKKDSRGLFRSRSKRTQSTSGDSAQPETPVAIDDRKPIAAEGEIHEVGLAKDPSSNASGVRRSKTLPTKRHAPGAGASTKVDQRSISAGKHLDAPAMEKSATAGGTPKPLDDVYSRPSTAALAEQQELEAEVSSDKHVDSAVEETAHAAESTDPARGLEGTEPAKAVESADPATAVESAQPAKDSESAQLAKDSESVQLARGTESAKGVDGTESYTAARNPVQSDLPTPPPSKVVDPHAAPSSQQTQPASEK